MIHGIGTDILELRRLRETLARRGERFAEKVLGDEELAVWRARGARSEVRGLAFLATRFCAKEAFSKAIGLGIRQPMSWRACQTLNLASGQPVIRLSGVLAEWFAARGLSAHVTVTDEVEYAAAFVVVECRPTGADLPAGALAGVLAGAPSTSAAPSPGRTADPIAFPPALSASFDPSSVR